MIRIAALAAVLASAPHPLPSTAMVDGKRVDAYPALWWQWVNRKRWGAQAFQDPTGAQCALNQHGAVWFLAGTDGTDAVHRKCNVPEGKHIFLPVITMVANAIPGTPQTCAQVKAKASANNAHAVAGEISLDGERFKLQGLRMRSDCFSAYQYADHLKNPQSYFPAATDGYWLMLPPLSKGRHVLRVDAHYANRGAEYGQMQQRFEYVLFVGKAPPPRRDRDDPDPERPESYF